MSKIIRGMGGIKQVDLAARRKKSAREVNWPESGTVYREGNRLTVPRGAGGIRRLL